jgi:hypothetical protein
MPRSVWLVWLPFLVLCGAVRAASVDDARTLKDEAVKILQANSAGEADPKAYAEAVERLEKAQTLLDGAGQGGTSLGQEINSLLFWARKFSTTAVIGELDKSRAGPAAPARKTEPVAPPPAAQTADAAGAEEKGGAFGAQTVSEARGKFEAAEGFAKEHPGDDFTVALRWFQAADQLAGTEFAAKALTLAREAQERYAKKTAKTPEPELPDTPGNRLLRQAHQLVAEGKYEPSFPLYERAIQLSNTMSNNRELGHAYLKYAQSLKDKLAGEMEAAEEEFRKARREARDQGPPDDGGRRPRRPRRQPPSNYPPLAEARRKVDAVKEKMSEAEKYYDKAWEQFKKALDRASGKRDLDSAAHSALCLSLKADPNVKDSARIALAQFLKDYKPANDVERTLYEFCRSESQRLSPVGGAEK